MAIFHNLIVNLSRLGGMRRTNMDSTSLAFQPAGTFSQESAGGRGKGLSYSIQDLKKFCR